MKLLIFILGLAVASATISITPTVKDVTVPHTYQDVGKSFIYRYEAFINSTLPQSGLEFVGQKIKCDVELNILTSQIIHMNLTNILVQEVNGTYNATLKEKNIMYPVNISVWNSSLTQNYTRELRNPITFQYVNGKILKVFANKTDPEWVVNMKKGIINMLTLQLENEEVFEKKEDGISGTCQTVYHLKERRNKDNVRIFNVTKVRDMTNCTDTPTYLFKTNDLKTKECTEPECDKELTTPVKAIASFKYNVTGERNQAFIESCTSTASYVMSPTINIEDGSYAVWQNQSLVLKEVKSRKIKPLPELTQRGNIKFIFPEIVNDVDRWNSTLKKVEFFTNILSNQTFSNFTLDSPSHFIHLVRSLRECNITQLRQVWKWTEKTTYKRDYIIKALPYVNKTDMTQLVKEMFFNHTINMTNWHAEELLIDLGSVQKPCIKMVQDIKEVCQSETFKEPTKDVTRENITKTMRIRRACFVSLGNMIQRFKKEEKFVPTTIVRSMTDCQETWKNPKTDTNVLNKDTVKALMEVRDSDVKMHCIEAMGNAGLPDHTQFLKETIEDKTLQIDLRLAAVTSLRRIAHVLPRKVITILLPILKNPAEDSEVRVTCYLIIMECKPTPAMLTLITEGVNKWTNPEVRSFVLSHLKNLAKSTNPREKLISKAARYALLTIRPFNITSKMSQNRRMEFFTEDKRVGAKCELNTVFSKQNIIPRKVDTKCDVALSGQYFNLFEMNVHTDSLNDILDRIFGTHGSWQKRQSFFDMMKEKRTQETTDRTKEELANLKLKVDPFTKKTQRHASTQFKMFDTEVWYNKMDDKFFNELMDEGKLSTKMVDIEMELMKPQHLDFTRVTMTEIHQQFPTIVGMPLSLNMTSSAVIRVTVNTTFTAQPSLQDVTHTDLVAHVNVTPEINFINMQSFGCHTPLNKLVSESNTTLNFTLPLTTKLIVDYDTKKYEVEIYHMTKERVDVLTLKHNITLIHEKTMCGKNQIFRRNVTVINGTQTGPLVNNTMCFQPYDDCMKVCMNYTTFRKTKRTTDTLTIPFLTALEAPTVFEIFAKKGTFNPDEIVFEYQPLRLQEWPRVKTMQAKIRFAAEKPSERPDFVERSLSADIILTKQSDSIIVTGSMIRSDISDWRAMITGEQNPEGDVELECEWGKPKEHNVIVNNTEKRVSREFFIKFISDRWLLPTQTVHNMTILWADTPEWLKTCGQTYKTWAPMTKYFLVKTFTPWEMTIEPKRSWIDNSYQMCMKTKTNETVDLIIVMPDQELTVKDITTPVHTKFLKKSMPAIVESLYKPNITFIPKPTTCKMTTLGSIKTFDKVTLNYTLPGTCPHVLVKDCSTDERFTVLVQNVTLREETDTVRTGLKSIVYVSKTKFELLTTLHTDLATKKLEVKVNGQKVLENWNFKPEIMVENTNTTIKRNDTHITLISGQGITVVLSTLDLQVNVTHRHWNTTCGLCGNNDGEMKSEFRTPWTSLPTHVTNTTKFGVSWLVQGDDCKDQECNLKKFASFPINLLTNEEIKIGEKQAACFSTEPVFYCPKDCSPVAMNEIYPGSTYTPEKITVDVGFHCLRTTDPAAQYTKMENMQFGTKVVDIVKEVEVPRKCICLDTCTKTKKNW